MGKVSSEANERTRFRSKTGEGTPPQPPMCNAQTRRGGKGVTTTYILT